MATPAEIPDGYKTLNPKERSESMARALSKFDERMMEDNRRTLSRVLDMIAETDTSEQVRLDMLATHIYKETHDYDAVKWPGDNERWRGITRLSDFMPLTGSGGESGTCPWSNGPLGDGIDEGFVEGLLQDLEKAVRRNASRELLGRTAETLELPAEYCEFFKQTHGVVCRNWDRAKFVSDFSATYQSSDSQALPLDKLCRYAHTRRFEVAAGWLAGQHDTGFYFCYLLCKKKQEPDEPLQWRIFSLGCDSIGDPLFDNMSDFLHWYASGYDHVIWSTVKENVDEVHAMCVESEDEDEDGDEDEDEQEA